MDGLSYLLASLLDVLQDGVVGNSGLDDNLLLLERDRKRRNLRHGGLRLLAGRRARCSNRVVGEDRIGACGVVTYPQPSREHVRQRHRDCCKSSTIDKKGHQET